MASLKVKIEAEFENIDSLISELPGIEKLPLLEFLNSSKPAELY